MLVANKANKEENRKVDLTNSSKVDKPAWKRVETRVRRPQMTRSADGGYEGAVMTLRKMHDGRFVEVPSNYASIIGKVKLNVEPPMTNVNLFRNRFHLTLIIKNMRLALDNDLKCDVRIS